MADTENLSLFIIVPILIGLISTALFFIDFGLFIISLVCFFSYIVFVFPVKIISERRSWNFMKSNLKRTIFLSIVSGIGGGVIYALLSINSTVKDQYNYFIQDGIYSISAYIELFTNISVVTIISAAAISLSDAIILFISYCVHCARRSRHHDK